MRQGVAEGLDIACSAKPEKSDRHRPGDGRVGPPESGDWAGVSGPEAGTERHLPEVPRTPQKARYRLEAWVNWAGAKCERWGGLLAPLAGR